MSKLAKAVFIAARNGCHDWNNLHLSGKGMQQMKDLAAAVKKVATKRGLKVEILSSAEPCAIKGAGLISVELHESGQPPPLVVVHECFWADANHRGDCELAVKIVEALFRDGVLLLLVSNVMMSHRLVRYIAGREGFDAKMGEIGYGKGLMVAKKGVSVIPRQ